MRCLQRGQVLAVCRALCDDISERHISPLGIGDGLGSADARAVGALCQSMHALLLLLAHLPRQGERADRDFIALLPQIHAKVQPARQANQ